MRQTPAAQTEPHAQSEFCVQKGGGRRLSTRHAPLSQKKPVAQFESSVHWGTQAPLLQIVPPVQVTVSQLPAGGFWQWPLTHTWPPMQLLVPVPVQFETHAPSTHE